MCVNVKLFSLLAGVTIESINLERSDGVLVDQRPQLENTEMASVPSSNQSNEDQLKELRKNFRAFAQTKMKEKTKRKAKRPIKTF